MSLSELRSELRGLRKGVVMPVSRMKKADVVREIERLKGSNKPVVKEAREEEPKKKVEAKKVVKKVEKEEKAVEKKEKGKDKKVGDHIVKKEDKKVLSKNKNGKKESRHDDESGVDESD
jgi:hypothetical protein